MDGLLVWWSRSDDSLHILGHGVEEESLEHIVIESRIVLAGPLAVWRKGDLQ